MPELNLNVILFTLLFKISAILLLFSVVLYES